MMETGIDLPDETLIKEWREFAKSEGLSSFVICADIPSRECYPIFVERGEYGPTIAKAVWDMPNQCAIRVVAMRVHSKKKPVQQMALIPPLKEAQDERVEAEGGTHLV